MKAPSFSRISIVLGLVLGIIVLWSGASPSTVSAKSLIGGFHPGPPCGPCDGTGEGTCDQAASGPGEPPGSLGCTTTGPVYYCETNPLGSGTCIMNGNVPCEKEGDPEACNTTEDMPCDGL